MKNRIIPALALVLLSAPLFSQNKETRTVDSFTKISFRVGGHMYIKQGSPQKVEIEGKQDVLAKIETEVSGGKLKVEREGKGNWSWKNDDDINVYITVPNIDEISVGGSGDVVAQTKLTGGDFDVSVSGSGSLEAEIEATGKLDADVSGSGEMDLKGKFKSVDSHVSGSGDIKIDGVIAETAEFNLSGSGTVKATGSAQEVKATISGSGKVLAQNMEVDKCSVRISGSGDVEINVKSDLDANISGSGSVSYKGNPNHVNSHSSGSGNIRKM